jgi:hypothetical protein
MITSQNTFCLRPGHIVVAALTSPRRVFEERFPVNVITLLNSQFEFNVTVSYIL